MRFRYKVIIINIVLLSIALGILGFIMIYKNFNQVLDIQMNYAIEEHNLIQSSIEYQLLDVLNANTPNLTTPLSNAGKETGAQILSEHSTMYILYNDTLVYSNTDSSSETDIPDSLLSALELGGKKYMTCKENDDYSLYTASKNILNDKELFIVTKRNVNDAYSLLYNQIGFFILLVMLVLLICSAFLYLAGTHLTKPLEQLNEVTDTIARGDYAVRADIQSDDEIGMVAEKFNKMASAISKHIEELNLMVKQREQFVADFTHEIKTPMTAIIGYADTLRSKSLAPERQQLAYQYIYSEGKRLETMSMKLFDLIYLRDNQLIKAEIQTVLLGKEVSESMQPILDRKDIMLKTRITPAVIYGDLELLKTVFINLIDNARKASPQGTQIEFEGYPNGDTYVFRVIDHGCGMDEETKQHICDEFYMADKSRSREEGGAGLGMSLAALIIQKHDARLEIESTLGAGSVFSVIIKQEG